MKQYAVIAVGFVVGQIEVIVIYMFCYLYNVSAAFANI
jgi:hypothetical protein